MKSEGQSLHRVPEHVELVRNCARGDYIKKDEFKFQVFWDVTLCYWVSGCGRFKRIVLPFVFRVK